MTFSYPEVGATGRPGPLPAGYRHLRYRARLGQGRELFAAAGERVLSWRMHRDVGVRVTATAARAAPGARVRVLVGRGRLGVAAPCEVVWVADGPTRRGFAYGSLPGHPECGEEAFLVELTADQQVWFSVTAFSRPAAWYTRLGYPFAVLFQELYARRCARVLRIGAVRAVDGAGLRTAG